MKKKLTFLGIETSCDETAASIVRENGDGTGKILSNVVSSQVDVHKDFGGVVPELAARSHIEKIDLITKKAINESGVTLKDIDAAVFGSGETAQWSLFTPEVKAKKEFNENFIKAKSLLELYK